MNVLLNFINLEVNMCNFERCNDMSRIPQENDSGKNKEISMNEPILEFKNSSFRYRKDIDNVLVNLNAKMFTGEKIGIVGRTGAGKSSLTLGISRIIDISDGQMLI